MKLVDAIGEIVLDDALPFQSVLTLFGELAPRIGARVVDRSGVERVFGDRTIDVIMPERDVIPAMRPQCLDRDFHRRSIQLAPVSRQHPFDLTMQEEDVVLRRRIRLEPRTALSHVGYRENCEVVLIDAHPPGLALHDGDAQLAKKPEDAAGLTRARRVVVSGDDNDLGVRQRPLQPLELNESCKDCRIGRTDGVEHIAGDEHELGREADDAIDYGAEGFSDINLTLIDAACRLALVLSEAEMYVCEVYQSHRARIALIHCVIFVRTCIGALCSSPLPAGACAIVERTMMLLLESVIQPSLRSIWMVPVRVPEVM